jgi:hypothetical protein
MIKYEIREINIDLEKKNIIEMNSVFWGGE